MRSAMYPVGTLKISTTIVKKIWVNDIWLWFKPIELKNGVMMDMQRSPSVMADSAITRNKFFRASLRARDVFILWLFLCG